MKRRCAHSSTCGFHTSDSKQTGTWEKKRFIFWHFFLTEALAVTVLPHLKHTLLNKAALLRVICTFSHQMVLSNDAASSSYPRTLKVGQLCFLIVSQTTCRLLLLVLVLFRKSQKQNEKEKMTHSFAQITPLFRAVLWREIARLF